MLRDFKVFSYSCVSVLYVSGSLSSFSLFFLIELGLLLNKDMHFLSKKY